jgi:hypothetical protein
LPSVQALVALLAAQKLYSVVSALPGVILNTVP